MIRSVVYLLLATALATAQVDPKGKPYLRFEYILYPGTEREPTLSEVEEVMCQTGFWCRDVARVGLGDETINCEAMYIDWQYTEGEPITIQFLANTTYEDGTSVPFAEVADLLPEADIELYIQNYIYKVEMDNVFLNVQETSFTSAPETDIPEGQIMVANCDPEDEDATDAPTEGEDPAADSATDPETPPGEEGEDPPAEEENPPEDEGGNPPEDEGGDPDTPGEEDGSTMDDPTEVNGGAGGNPFPGEEPDDGTEETDETDPDSNIMNPPAGDETDAGMDEDAEPNVLDTSKCNIVGVSFECSYPTSIPVGDKVTEIDHVVTCPVDVRGEIDLNANPESCTCNANLMDTPGGSRNRTCACEICPGGMSKEFSLDCSAITDDPYISADCTSIGCDGLCDDKPHPTSMEAGCSQAGEEFICIVRTNVTMPPEEQAEIVYSITCDLDDDVGFVIEESEGCTCDAFKNDVMNGTVDGVEDCSCEVCPEGSAEQFSLNCGYTEDPNKCSCMDCNGDCVECPKPANGTDILSYFNVGTISDVGENLNGTEELAKCPMELAKVTECTNEKCFGFQEKCSSELVPVSKSTPTCSSVKESFCGAFTAEDCCMEECIESFVNMATCLYEAKPVPGNATMPPISCDNETLSCSDSTDSADESGGGGGGPGSSTDGTDEDGSGPGSSTDEKDEDGSGPGDSSDTDESPDGTTPDAGDPSEDEKSGASRVGERLVWVSGTAFLGGFWLF